LVWVTNSIKLVFITSVLVWEFENNIVISDSVCGHPVSSARIEQHFDPSRTRRDLLSGILGPPSLGEADTHSIGVDRADTHAVWISYSIAVWVTSEYVQTVAGRYAENQIRLAVWIVQCRRINEHRPVTKVVRPHAVFFSAQS